MQTEQSINTGGNAELIVSGSEYIVFYYRTAYALNV